MATRRPVAAPVAAPVAPVVADICLYGNSDTGAGWIATDGNKPYGTGEPKADRSFTEAVWLAVDALRDAGHVGAARVFAPGGHRMARIDTRAHVPTFGSLTWEAAPVYTLTVG